jgi:hypothetical protein
MANAWLSFTKANPNVFVHIWYVLKLCDVLFIKGEIIALCIICVGDLAL